MAYLGGPFGTTGLGVPVAEVPSEPRTTFSTSRSIVFETMRYEQNEDGGFVGMSDTLQCVLLALAFNVREPKIITPQNLRKVENEIRTALEPLTRGPRPSIKILKIEARDDGKDKTTKLVSFLDLKSNTTQTVPVN